MLKHFPFRGPHHPFAGSIHVRVDPILNDCYLRAHSPAMYNGKQDIRFIIMLNNPCPAAVASFTGSRTVLFMVINTLAVSGSFSVFVKMQPTASSDHRKLDGAVFFHKRLA